MKALGARNEWTARVPSALAVLALVLATVAMVIPWRGAETALIAALAMMTNLGLLEKGRLAEIEAIYISLSGIAIVCWMSFWAQKKSPWLIWTVPFVFLGLAALAKGPLHLLFFYAIAVPVLWRAREMRELGRPPHIIGLLVMVAIFSTWLIPYRNATAHLNATAVWMKQMEERVGGGGINIASVFVNLPRGVANFLPWVLLLPLLWKSEPLERLPERDALIVRATRWPLVICFFALLLIPGMLPRYTLPMLAPTSVVLAIVLQVRFAERARKWSLGAAAVAAIAMCVYALLIVPHVNAEANVRGFGEKVDAAVPGGEPLYVFDCGFLPELFYVKSHCVYAQTTHDLPDTGGIVLTRLSSKNKLQRMWPETRSLAELQDKNKNAFFVLQLRRKL